MNAGALGQLLLRKAAHLPKAAYPVPKAFHSCLKYRIV
jgi:hypothetical protein